MGRIKKRAQFLTIDALIALTIIIITVFIIAPMLYQPKTESSVASDVLQSLSTLKIGEMASESEMATWGITDPEKPVIDQIGELYITDISIAKTLSERAISSISPTENIGIWYGSELLASRNITPIDTAKNVFTDRQVISGIGGEGTGVTGFSARAFLSSPTRTEYFYFGGYVGEGNISTLINYNGNITSAEIELVASEDFNIYVNGVKDSTDFASSPNEYTPVSYVLDTSTFVSGSNTLEIKSEDFLHIAGGFVKIIYESEVTYEQPERYYFPGIEGIINLYDGFYVPGNLTGLTVYLHFNNSINTFLTIGKTQIFNDTSDGTAITISNSTLFSLLDYEDLSQKTIPVRFGIEETDYVSSGAKDVDVISSTDISGSMASDCSGERIICCWGKDCNNNEANCNNCGGTFTDKIQDAKDANYLFIDMILNNTNNRVGLNAYSTSVLSSNKHELSNNNISLKSEVASWNEGGSTCICCGINSAVDELLANSDSEKFQSIVIMTDGEANVECSQQGTTADLNRNGQVDDAGDDAIQAACDAYENYGIKIYTIGFGSGDTQTLIEMAACADGSFYNSVDDIEVIYETIAEEIINTAFYEQTVEISGADFKSQLFPDSYIEFDYVKKSSPTGLVVTLEEQFDTSSTANFSLPQNSTALEANVISYSGPKWTNKVSINDNVVYNLSAYETDYLNLGDPYSVNIPASLIEENNSIFLNTGLSSSNTSEGSINNIVVYTVAKGVSSYTSISAKAVGCNWNIQLPDSIVSMPIPLNYSGIETCSYTMTEKLCDIYSECEGATDAIQIAVYNLLESMDFNSDGMVDIDFNEDNIQISTSDLEGVPFHYSTEVQVRKWY